MESGCRRILNGRCETTEGQLTGGGAELRGGLLALRTRPGNITEKTEKSEATGLAARWEKASEFECFHPMKGLQYKHFRLLLCRTGPGLRHNTAALFQVEVAYCRWNGGRLATRVQRLGAAEPRLLVTGVRGLATGVADVLQLIKVLITLGGAWARPCVGEQAKCRFNAFMQLSTCM